MATPAPRSLNWSLTEPAFDATRPSGPRRPPLPAAPCAPAGPCAWDYNALAWRDTLAGNPKAAVIIPKSGTLAGVYVQAISAYAPHPSAAKLWMEYIYSDEGQLGWLNGYCHPIRFNDLAKRGVIPADMMAKLPPAEAYAKAVFPTLAEQSAHKEGVSAGWDKVVGVEVK